METGFAKAGAPIDRERPDIDFVERIEAQAQGDEIVVKVEGNGGVGTVRLTSDDYKILELPTR